MYMYWYNVYQLSCIVLRMCMFMTLIIMWYQRAADQCSTAYTPLVPRVYIIKVTQSSCGFLSMRFINHTTSESAHQAADVHVRIYMPIDMYITVG